MVRDAARRSDDAASIGFDAATPQVDAATCRDFAVSRRSDSWTDPKASCRGEVSLHPGNSQVIRYLPAGLRALGCRNLGARCLNESVQRSNVVLGCCVCFLRRDGTELPESADRSVGRFDLLANYAEKKKRPARRNVGASRRSSDPARVSSAAGLVQIRSCRKARPCRGHSRSAPGRLNSSL